MDKYLHNKSRSYHRQLQFVFKTNSQILARWLTELEL